MSYEKQTWNGYDEALSTQENIERYAVAMPGYMNHIEEGIEELDRKSFNSVELQYTTPDGEASAEVIDGVLHLTLPSPESGSKGDPGEKGEQGEPGADGQPGRDGYSVGVSSTEPVDGVISVSDVESVNSISDCFIAPSGRVYIINTASETEYGVTPTSVMLAGGKDGEQGETGADGKSAYQVAVDNGFTGTEEEWLTSLKGEPGIPGEKGDPGANGKSAYEIAVTGGFEGDEAAWLASLKGADGADGTPGLGVCVNEPVMDTENPDMGIIDASDITPAIAVGGHFVAPSGAIYEVTAEADGVCTVTKTQVSMPSGGGEATPGVDGKSAYELAVEGGFEGDQAAWLASLVGTDGTNGHSVGVAIITPVDGEIAASQINSVSQIGDHFIAPSGEIYKIIGTKENEEDIYMTEGTGITMSGASIDFKGEAIGHCSGLTVATDASTAEYQKKPPIKVQYTDPAEEGIPYGGTIVAIKEGVEPTSPEDADIVENVMDKNKYKDAALEIIPPRTGGNEAHTKTFFATLFPYSASGVRNMLRRESKSIVLNYAEYVKSLRLNKVSEGEILQPGVSTLNLVSYDTPLYDYKGKKICLINRKIVEWNATTRSFDDLYELPNYASAGEESLPSSTAMYVIADKIFVVESVKTSSGYRYETMLYNPDDYSYIVANIRNSGTKFYWLNAIKVPNTDYTIVSYTYGDNGVSNALILFDKDGNKLSGNTKGIKYAYNMHLIKILDKIYLVGMGNTDYKLMTRVIEINSDNTISLNNNLSPDISDRVYYKNTRFFQKDDNAYMVIATSNGFRVSKFDSISSLSTKCTYELTDTNLNSTNYFRFNIMCIENKFVISYDSSVSKYYVFEEVEVEE